MCGIAGKFIFESSSQVTKNELELMTKTIRHRGPDGFGFYLDKNLGLGHARLAIIDLSKRGTQPMSNEDGTVWITFNGEVYNFLKLRPELEKKGYRFKSNTDTECIIHLYEEYGVKCLEHLRGFFAFAIWDKKKRQLFLARDRVGKKPLKYYIDDKKFVFASELKAILKDKTIKSKPDWEIIHHYLSFQYAPTPSTGFKGIKKLPPAHYAVISENGSIEIKRYWQLDYSKKLDLSENEWQKEVIKSLEEAVKIRLIADVPLGAFLSGGIDSSLVVALMSKFSKKPVKTFSIGFPEKDFDETPFARSVAKIFKTDHQEFLVTPDAIEMLPKLVYQYEEPYADSSAIPSWCLAEMTRRYVTVALNGDGGDENFAGYTRYNLYKITQRLKGAPVNVVHLALKSWLKLTNPSRIEKLDRYFETLKEARKEGSPEKSYFDLISYFNTKQKIGLYTESFKQQLNKYNSAELLRNRFLKTTATDPIEKVVELDTLTYLPDDLLVKIDISTMAHSLEARSPLLDNKFMELTAKIPFSLKLKGLNNKYIFKKAVQTILPKDILDRPKKGFGVPLEHWFRNELKDYVKEILLSKECLNRGLFKKESIKSLIEKHQSGRTNYAHHLWALLTLEHWFRTFFD